MNRILLVLAGCLLAMAPSLSAYETDCGNPQDNYRIRPASRPVVIRAIPTAGVSAARWWAPIPSTHFGPA